MPNRPDDEELTLYFYGEHPAPGELERALAADPERARRYERLRRELEALGAIEPPEPRAGLEGRLWHRLAPELAAARARRAPFGSGWARFALAAAAALALVAGGFLAGRVTRTPPATEVASAAPAPLAADARERLLEASLVAHLEGSERLLVELANDPGDTDFAADERRFAETLLASNRLYRRAAERNGQRRIAALLAELEPLLIELSHPNGTGGDGAVATAKQHLESRDLLFKVRVTRSRI